MDQKFNTHVKAFLLSHLFVEESDKNLAKIRVIANTNPDHWDGKLPRGIRSDADFCKVAEATKSRPVSPWWWYAKERETVPAVVEDIYKGLTFDFAVVYPKENVYIYVNVEPSPDILKLLRRQEQLKAFILVSLINKKFSKTQREGKRLRLATVMGSKDMNKVFAFVACKAEDSRYSSLAGVVPTLTRLVHQASNTANWSIRIPKDNRIYGSFRELIAAR
jgi:hypothetical protein